MEWINNGFKSVKELIESRKLSESYSQIVNLREAAEMIRTTYLPIVIVGDYDVDGIMASVILSMTLERMNKKHRVRLPKRLAEGYGLSIKIIEECNEPEALIITVDNGIAAVDAIKLAKKRGYEVIVTDHHQPQSEIPPADIIVDPHYTGGEYVDFCGAGIALMLAEELLGKGKANFLYPFAAAATIADVVPLTGDNRRICRAAKKQTLPEGLELLKVKMGVDPLHSTEEDDKFSTNPAINASSRILDDAYLAFRLFTTRNADEREELADKLVAANAVRKEQSAIVLQKAEHIIEEECMFGDCPLVLNIPDVNLGIIGIVAGKLAEEYNVPTIVVTKNNDILKGSCRVPNTIEEYDIKEELEKVSDLLLSFGGHKMAAGLSFKEDNLDKVRAAMQKSIVIPEKVGHYDFTIKADEVPDTVDEIEAYGPYGPGNDIPIVRVEDIKICPRYGKTHLFMGTTTPAVKIFGNGISLIYFGIDASEFTTEDTGSLACYGQLCMNWFNGRCEPQIILSDKPEKKAIRKTSLAERLAARAKMI